jgi:hypothetical protein
MTKGQTKFGRRDVNDARGKNRRAIPVVAGVPPAGNNDIAADTAASTEPEAAVSG